MYAIITKEIVNEALQFGNTKIHNAIISLMYTSSLDKDTIANLKIEDLIKACSAYFNKDENQNIGVLLAKDTGDMYPCWVSDSDDNHRVTFNTPVASYYLFDYLKENAKYYDLNSMDPVFKIRHRGSEDFDGIDGNYINKFFNKKSKPLNELKLIPSNLKFTPNAFNKSFKKISEGCFDIDDKSELIDLFMGHATDDNKYYKQYLDDSTSILTYYKTLLPYIELDNVMSVQQPITQNQIIPQEPTISKEYDNETIQTISKYYNSNVKDSTHTYEKYIYLTDYVHDCIKNAKNLGIPQDLSKTNFDHLFKRAEFNWALKQYHHDVSMIIYSQFNKEDLLEAASVLDEIGINKIVPVFHDLFADCLGEVIAADFAYTDSVMITESEYSQAFSCYLHKLDNQSRKSTYFNRK